MKLFKKRVKEKTKEFRQKYGENAEERVDFLINRAHWLAVKKEHEERIPSVISVLKIIHLLERVREELIKTKPRRIR